MTDLATRAALAPIEPGASRPFPPLREGPLPAMPSRCCRE